MAESILLTKSADKATIYKELIPQIGSIIDGEDNLIANLANVASALNMAFGHLWIGFYIYDQDKEQLVLGPFQGPIACTRIPLKPVARGVCGVAAVSCETQLVSDVNQFQGHIACSSDSKSEIVVPLVVDGQTKLVLDIDSIQLNTFDEIDQQYCEQIIEMIKQNHFKV